jgi:branched-subunit amino acid aminotransferase/4-amino-4-deoxychorismate lyase
MSSPAAPTSATYRWHDGALHPIDRPDADAEAVAAADSWLVTGGRTLAIGLHRARFLAAVQTGLGAEAFWDAALAAIPRDGDWFPRVELRSRSGAPTFDFVLRGAPARSRSVVLATHAGGDPRTTPTVKGPDLAALALARAAVQPLGAGEAVILSPDGYVVEGAYSSLVWWRGAILCSPPASLERIDGVTVRSLLGLAAALGVETHEELVTPAELDGTELWSLSALHGPRIVTSWVGGPGTAELPGRLALWRTRLEALRHPLP